MCVLNIEMHPERLLFLCACNMPLVYTRACHEWVNDVYYRGQFQCCFDNSHSELACLNIAYIKISCGYKGHTEISAKSYG